MDLREAHHLNDLLLNAATVVNPLKVMKKDLEYLFKLYEQMIEEEIERDTLFAKEKKKRKRKKKK